MSSSSSTKVCFNLSCKESLSQSRKGWRRRTGEFADLCDRCASVYEEGKFCETFHLNASGWRSCECCGKQIHCGCIVSFHMFVLLDAGGIECITCARKSFILTPNPAWPPPSLFLPVQPERIKDLSVKNWSSMAGSGPVPWRQAPSLFNASTTQSELQPRMPFDVDISSGFDKLGFSELLSVASLEIKKQEDSYGRLMNGSMKSGVLEIPENGGNTGTNYEEQHNPSINVSQQSFLSKNDPFPTSRLAPPSASNNSINDQTKVSGTHRQRITPPSPAGKQLCGSNGMDSSAEAQIRNGKPRGDSRGRNQLFSRYWPRITDQELQQISGDSNSVITPLFEKMLSASDAGRIGRLVLPKKCAEAYFPPISQPEGLPLKVQDSQGREWVFQFRFWPNNNSRMYVLEGVTPCIQSMQLQAGDTVTFSRVEPEGKLVMGCRKASNAPSSDKGNETVNTGNGVVSMRRDVSIANAADPASTLSKVDKSGYIAREVLEARPSSRKKRKNSTLGSKSKRLRIENEDRMELNLTWEQAQGLFRPPPDHAPTIVVIEGFEFEEYEDAPVIGRPTIPATDNMGEEIQWAQCEDCLKWRKVPANILLPPKWTCSGNSWDPDRSLCLAAQELTSEHLQDLLHTSNKAASKKMKAAKQDPDSAGTMEGLDKLADLAIQEEGEGLPSSSQATTKHPRHRPGCTCIVCIQPPSGKGHKHKQSCDCNVCATVKRRFHTLLLRREKKQSEKEAETERQKLQQQLLPEQMLDGDVQQCSDAGNTSPNQEMVCHEGSENDPNMRTTSISPFKCQIDLNIQPEREEDLSPSSDSGGTMRLLQDATETHLRQQRFSNSISNGNSVGNQTKQDGFGGENCSSNTASGSSLQKPEANHDIITPINPLASTSTTDR